MAETSHSKAPYGAPELAALRPGPETHGAAGSSDAGREEPDLSETLLWERFLQTRDADVREQLIVQHLPYARAVAAGLYRQHMNHETDYHEYVQWATIGMIEALDRYDPSRGAQFRTYAHLRILGAIRNGLEHISERQEQLGLHRRLTAERLAAAKRGKNLEDPDKSPVQLMRDVADIGAGLMLSFMLESTGMLEDETSALPDGAYSSLLFKQEKQRLHDLLDELTPR